MSSRIVDLSGFMFSGKAAASDLLREFRGISVPNYRVEFDLLRVAGGLADLKNAVEDWSPIRTHAALDRFERTVRQLASTPGRLAKYVTTGYGYSKLFPRIEVLLDRFIEEITEVEWQTPWPYDDLTDGPIATFLRKVRTRAGKNKFREYRLVSKEKFLPAAQAFVHALLWEGVDLDSVHMVVAHNALEPFNPERHIDLLGPGARCIVVDRDPRDIYATAITTQTGFNDQLEFYRRIAGAHDVDVFIKRYLVYRRYTTMDESRVLRIRFEDLVRQYDETVAQIMTFLALDDADHTYRQMHFKPEQSARNIGLWRDAKLKSHEADFARIAEQCNV